MSAIHGKWKRYDALLDKSNQEANSTPHATHSSGIVMLQPHVLAESFCSHPVQLLGTLTFMEGA